MLLTAERPNQSKNSNLVPRGKSLITSLIVKNLTDGNLSAHFCYHPMLSISGSCRVCVSEASQTSKPLTTCTHENKVLAQKIEEVFSMLYIRSVFTRKSKEGVSEFLLCNHPTDCPLCNQSGTCDLQDQADLFDSSCNRFNEDRRKSYDELIAILDMHVKTSMLRCIHCGRCERFGEEVAGISDLGFIGRGKNSQIGTYLPKILTTELSGNLIELCPVGFFTYKQFTIPGIEALITVPVPALPTSLVTIPGLSFLPKGFITIPGGFELPNGTITVAGGSIPLGGFSLPGGYGIPKGLLWWYPGGFERPVKDTIITTFAQINYPSFSISLPSIYCFAFAIVVTAISYVLYARKLVLVDQTPRKKKVLNPSKKKVLNSFKKEALNSFKKEVLNRFRKEALNPPKKKGTTQNHIDKYVQKILYSHLFLSRSVNRNKKLEKHKNLDPRTGWPLIRSTKITHRSLVKSPANAKFNHWYDYSHLEKPKRHTKPQTNFNMRPAFRNNTHNLVRAKQQPVLVVFPRDFLTRGDLRKRRALRTRARETFRLRSLLKFTTDRRQLNSLQKSTKDTYRTDPFKFNLVRLLKDLEGKHHVTASERRMLARLLTYTFMPADSKAAIAHLKRSHVPDSLALLDFRHRKHIKEYGANVEEVVTKILPNTAKILMYLRQKRALRLLDKANLECGVSKQRLLFFPKRIPTRTFRKCNPFELKAITSCMTTRVRLRNAKALVRSFKLRSRARTNLYEEYFNKRVTRTRKVEKWYAASHSKLIDARVERYLFKLWSSNIARYKPYRNFFPLSSSWSEQLRLKAPDGKCVSKIPFDAEPAGSWRRIRRTVRQRSSRCWNTREEPRFKRYLRVYNNKLYWVPSPGQKSSGKGQLIRLWHKDMERRNAHWLPGGLKRKNFVHPADLSRRHGRRLRFREHPQLTRDHSLKNCHREPKGWSNWKSWQRLKGWSWRGWGWLNWKKNLVVPASVLPPVSSWQRAKWKYFRIPFMDQYNPTSMSLSGDMLDDHRRRFSYSLYVTNPAYIGLVHARHIENIVNTQLNAEGAWLRKLVTVSTHTSLHKLTEVAIDPSLAWNPVVLLDSETLLIQISCKHDTLNSKTTDVILKILSEIQQDFLTEGVSYTETRNLRPIRDSLDVVTQVPTKLYFARSLPAQFRSPLATPNSSFTEDNFEGLLTDKGVGFFTLPSGRFLGVVSVLRRFLNVYPGDKEAPLLQRSDVLKHHKWVAYLKGQKTNNGPAQLPMVQPRRFLPDVDFGGGIIESQIDSMLREAEKLQDSAKKLKDYISQFDPRGRKGR